MGPLASGPYVEARITRHNERSHDSFARSVSSLSWKNRFENGSFVLRNAVRRCVDAPNQKRTLLQYSGPISMRRSATVTPENRQRGSRALVD